MAGSQVLSEKKYAESIDIPFQRRKCPEQKANIFSRIFLAWVFPLVLQGWRSPLQDTDLWELPDRERGRNATKELEDAIKVVLKENADSNGISSPPEFSKLSPSRLASSTRR